MGNTEIIKKGHNIKEIQDIILKPKTKAQAPFICKVLSYKKLEESQYILLNVSLGEGGLCKQFIISKGHPKLKIQNEEMNDLKSENEDISPKIFINSLLKVNKYRGVMINSQLHCEILDFNITAKFKAISLVNEKIVTFMKSTYLNALPEPRNKKFLFSIYLHCLSEGNIFKDSNESQIQLNITLESNKKYFFNSLLWNPKHKRVECVDGISFYEEINPRLNIHNEVYKLNKGAGKVITGKVIKAKFFNNKIVVKTINNEILNFQLNGKLIRKISFNSLCHFINFDKTNNNNYKFNDFSHIIIEEKTIIRFIFKDYQFKNKYDSIKINDQFTPIDHKELLIELKNVPDNNYFRQEIVYLKNRKEIHKFIVEVYKERINNVYSYLNLKKDGFSYDHLCITKNAEHLFKYQKINIDGEEVTLDDIEKFENNLKGRICIINIEEQNKSNIKTIKMNLNNVKGEKQNSFKILYLFDNDGNITKNEFPLKIDDNKKIPFKMDENYEKMLNDFYSKYSDNIIEFYKNKSEIIIKYEDLFLKEESCFKISQDKDYFIANDVKINNNKQEENSSFSSEDSLINNEYENGDKKKFQINKKVIDNEQNYRKYIELAFSQFTFDNSQKEFEKIKKLGFLQIIKYYNYGNSEHDKDIFQAFINNYKSLINLSNDMEYNERIKILLSFVNNRIFDEKFKYNYKDATYLVELKENINHEIDESGDYSYIKKAYKILYNILDHLEESSSFFIAIHQFNSYIDYSISSKENMFTGSLLTLNDVKLDFVKNISNYCLLNEIKNIDCFAHYCPYTKSIFYNPFTYLQNEVYLHKLKYTNEDSATLVSLYLIFHEVCGHLKTAINNTKDTPKKYYSNYLKIYSISGIIDSGYIFERFLCDGTIKPIDIMNSNDKQKIKSLLDYNNYIGEDFSYLKQKLNEIQRKGQNSNHSSGKKSKVKDDNENDEYDYDKMNISELYELFYQKPDNMTDEEYSNYLKNNKGYQKLLKIYTRTRTKP